MYPDASRGDTVRDRNNQSLVRKKIKKYLIQRPCIFRAIPLRASLGKDGTNPLILYQSTP